MFSHIRQGGIYVLASLSLLAAGGGRRDAVDPVGREAGTEAQTLPPPTAVSSGAQSLDSLSAAAPTVLDGQSSYSALARMISEPQVCLAASVQAGIAPVLVDTLMAREVLAGAPQIESALLTQGKVEERSSHESPETQRLRAQVKRAEEILEFMGLKGLPLHMSAACSNILPQDEGAPTLINIVCLLEAMAESSAIEVKLGRARLLAALSDKSFDELCEDIKNGLERSERSEAAIKRQIRVEDALVLSEDGVVSIDSWAADDHRIQIVSGSFGDSRFVIGSEGDSLIVSGGPHLSLFARMPFISWSRADLQDAVLATIRRNPGAVATVLKEAEGLVSQSEAVILKRALAELSKSAKREEIRNLVRSVNP